MQQAKIFVLLIARASVKRTTGTSLSIALALALALGGCTQSHVECDDEGVCLPNNVEDDADGDGYREPLDCDDGNPNINPLAREVRCDEVDDNCDGVDLCGVVGNLVSDEDGDGYDINYVRDEDESEDCDDTNYLVHTDGVDIPCDGIDQNCDGVFFCDLVECVDEDGDGFYSESPNGVCGPIDCNDDDIEIKPGVVDCECTKDMNCDGVLNLEDWCRCD